LAVDGGVHLIISGVYGRAVGEQGGNVHMTHFIKQVAEVGANLIWLKPTVVCGRLTA
jgi:hypothetical protein